MSQANEMTFGIEIECCLPRNVHISVGGYHSGHQVPGLPEGWKAQSDCSIQAPRGHYGVEIVSPVLRGAEGVKQVLAVCAWLAEKGARVNKSTGFHVHVGWAHTKKELARLAFLVANHEKALFASTGTHSREDGRFCRPIANAEQFVQAFKTGTQDRLPDNRYHLLNVTNLRSGRMNTVEFRCFAGTTNATKMLGYIRLCLGLVEKAIASKKRTAWDGKTEFKPGSGCARFQGQGQAQLHRLMSALNWDRLGKELGEVTAEGAPTKAEVKKELMRLAAKYDGGAND